jgi:hypothetical protein
MSLPVDTDLSLLVDVHILTDSSITLLPTGPARCKLDVQFATNMTGSGEAAVQIPIFIPLSFLNENVSQWDQYPVRLSPYEQLLNQLIDFYEIQ